MAFPTLADADTTKSTGSGTSASVDLPATVDAGDLLLIIIATDGDNTFGWTNFTEIDEGDDGKDIALACAYKVATGDEDGGTESVSLGSNERWAACCYRITSGTHGGASSPPEASTIATGEDAAANPTTCTPTGGAKDYLWITFMGLDNNSLSGATQPSGYSDMEYQDSGTPGMCAIATSYRTNNAASEDAGAWTNPDDDWAAFTVAVHPAGATAYSIDADPGSYSKTGIAATLVGAFILSAAVGTYGLTGAPATLAKGYSLSADPGSYTLTGIAADPIADRLITASPDSYALTGIAATLQYGRAVSADPGSYTQTGIAATLDYARAISASPGSYTKTGVAADLIATFILSADPGSYNKTGIAATLGTGLVIDASAGTYSLTGVAADLISTLILPADPGSYSKTGVAATLLKSEPDKVLSADPGAYSLTGIAATLARDIYITASPDSYSLTGIAATLQLDHGIVANAGSYTQTGIAADLLANRILSANPGAYSTTGTAATLQLSRGLIADPGSYTKAGIAASLIADRAIVASLGSYTKTGIAATLEEGTTAQPPPYALEAGMVLAVSHEAPMVLDVVDVRELSLQSVCPGPLPPAWSPTDIDGCVLWLRADSLSLNDGEQVETWQDESGEGNDLTQSTASKRPIFKENQINGKSAVRFDGIDDFLISDSFSSPLDAGTVLMVMNVKAEPASDPYFMDGIASGNRWAFYRNNTVEYLSLWAGTGFATGNYVVDVDTWYLLGFRINGTDEIRKNGNAIANGEAGSHTLTGLTLANNQAQNQPGQNDYATVLIYDNVIGSSDLQQVEEYLLNLYSI